MSGLLGQIARDAQDGNYASMVEWIRFYIWDSGIAESASEEEKKKIMDWLNLAIDDGNDVAMNILGAMYAEGRLVEADLSKAYEWYKRASDNGNRLATSNLGFCYLYGRGTEVDYEKAYYAFLDAAVLGEGDAIVRLGDMFFYGDYVEQNQARALRYYKHAIDFSKHDLPNLWAAQVYSDASKRVADCYLNGTSVEKDIEKAIYYYEEALRYYKEREAQGDSYCASGLEKTKQGLAKAKELLSSQQ